MFGEFKVYIYGIATAIVLAVLALLKYRGHKIDVLEEEVEEHEVKDKVQEFEKQNAVAHAKIEGEADVKVIPDGAYSL